MTWHKIRIPTNQMPLWEAWAWRNPETELLEGQLELCALTEGPSLRGPGMEGKRPPSWAALLGRERQTDPWGMWLSRVQICSPDQAGSTGVPVTPQQSF